MAFDKNKTLQFYEGVQHAPDDIRRKWRNTNVLFSDDEGNSFPVYISDIDAPIVYYSNALTERNFDTTVEAFVVAKEFPPNGVFSIDGGVYQLSRRQDRQWKRGTCPETTVIETLAEPRYVLPFDVLVARAFLFKPVSFDVAIATVKNKEPKVISKHMWLTARDEVLASLYYDDVFVGYVDKDRNFISHSESITLAEEAVNELGLHPV